MSIRRGMLQVARLAPKLLGDSTELVKDFLKHQQNSDGGFKDRQGRSDLYYTVFGLDGLVALQCPLPVLATSNYLLSFAGGEDLDFVHLCCLARGWSAVWEAAGTRDVELARRIIYRLSTFRSQDGGFNPKPGSRFGTAYGAFLALGTFLDLESHLVLTNSRTSDSKQENCILNPEIGILHEPESSRFVSSLAGLATADGAWSNDRLPSSENGRNGGRTRIQPPSGATNATAASILVLSHFGMPVSETAVQWLLAQSHPQGGFLAFPMAPMPDLLSTATTLHALAAVKSSLEPIREACLDFVDSLWTNEGGFHGNWADSALDCEYTFYGILALGHLSLST